MAHQPAVATGVTLSVNVTYQIVEFRTCVLKSFPEPAEAFDRVEISSDAAAVAALDAILVANLGTNTAAPGSQPLQAGTTPAVIGGSSANQVSLAVASPRIRCAARLYFRGLEASLLCEYDGATFAFSNFQMVDANEAWQRSNIKNFKIGHAVGWPLRDGSKDDRNERKFLGVYFRIGSGGDLTELLAKNIGPYRKKTVLTQSEWRGLNLKIWGELPEY